MRFGVSVNGKADQAMTFGPIVVGSSISFECMFMVNGRDCLDWIICQIRQSCFGTIRQQGIMKKISTNSRRMLKEHFSPEIAKETLKNLLDELSACNN